MPTYLCRTPIKLGGERYQVDDEIDLTDKQAKPLLAQTPPAIEAAPNKKAEKK